MKNYRISATHLEKHYRDEAWEPLIEALNTNPFGLTFGILSYSDGLKKKLVQTEDFFDGRQNVFATWSKQTTIVVGLTAEREIAVMASIASDYYMLTKFYGAKPNELFSAPFLDSYLSACGYKDVQHIQTATSMRGQGMSMWVLETLVATLPYVTLVPINAEVEQFCIAHNMKPLPMNKEARRPMYTTNDEAAERYVAAPTRKASPTILDVFEVEEAAKAAGQSIPVGIKAFKPYELVTFTGETGQHEKTVLLGYVTLPKKGEPTISLTVENYAHTYPLATFVEKHLACETKLIRFDEVMFELHNPYERLPEYAAYQFARRHNFNSHHALRSRV